MKVKNVEIWQAREPLQELMKAVWPVKTAYWLAKLNRKLAEQLAVLEEVRVRLVRQYGTTNEQGQLEVTPDCPEWEQFAGEFNELLAQEVELDIEKVTLTGDAQLTPDGLVALIPFVEVAE